MVNRAQIDWRREMAALGLLARAGVGYILANDALGDDHLEMVKDIGLAGSDPEAIVKLAIMFAYGNITEFKTYIENTQNVLGHKRYFRAVR